MEVGKANRQRVEGDWGWGERQTERDGGYVGGEGRGRGLTFSVHAPAEY